MSWRDRPLSRGMWLATCLTIGVVLAGFTVLWTSAAVDSHDAKTAATRQTEGRAVAIDVLCGFGNGVAEAGRKALAGELVGQHQANGLPPEAQRDYVATITSTLLAEAGISAQGVLEPNGEVNCARLRVAAKATHP
jgi:hypothetical protein